MNKFYFKFSFFRSYIRSIKEYFFLKEKILQSFFLQYSQIKLKNVQSIRVTENKNQIAFSNYFVKRMRRFLKNLQEGVGATSSHWRDIYNFLNFQDFTKNLMKMDDVSFFNCVANPHTNNLHYGFGDISKEIIENYRVWDFYISKNIYDTIFRICCSYGLRNCPETYHTHKFNHENPDFMLEDIFKYIGKKTSFPNIFIGEFGIKTKFGIISRAAIQQMYHATRLVQLFNDLKIKEPKVLEIGAGLGMSAYHSKNFGIENYFILDLPLVCISQLFFLASVIGEDNIITGDELLKINQSEEKFKKAIKLIASADLDLIPENIDLILNCDSLTEMSEDQALVYAKMAEKKSKYFLSFNHEGNQFNVYDILKNTSFKKVYRSQAWYRAGFVEELYVNTSLVKN
jgi:hypothetical protein